MTKILLYIIATILFGIVESIWPIGGILLVPTFLVILILYCLIKHSQETTLILSFIFGLIFDVFSGASYLGAGCIASLLAAYCLLRFSKGFMLSSISSLFILTLSASIVFQLSYKLTDYLVLGSVADLNFYVMVAANSVLTALIGSFILVNSVPSVSNKYR